MKTAIIVTMVVMALFGHWLFNAAGEWWRLPRTDWRYKNDRKFEVLGSVITLFACLGFVFTMILFDGK